MGFKPIYWLVGMLVWLVILPAHAKKIETNPEGAAVFHKVRGKHKLLGYTPLNLKSFDVENKSSPRLVVLKFGYEQSSVHVDMTQSAPVSIQLKPAKVAPQKEIASCTADILNTVEQYLATSNQPFHVLPLQIRSNSRTNENTLVMRFQVVDHDDSYQIKRTTRLARSALASVVSGLLDPVIKPILKLADKNHCLSFVQADVAFHASKRLKLNTVMNRTGGFASQSWLNNIGGSVYRTQVNYTWSGTNVSYEAGIVVNKDDKIVSLRYKLGSGE